MKGGVDVNPCRGVVDPIVARAAVELPNSGRLWGVCDCGRGVNVVVKGSCWAHRRIAYMASRDQAAHNEVSGGPQRVEKIEKTVWWNLFQGSETGEDDAKTRESKRSGGSW